MLPSINKRIKQLIGELGISGNQFAMQVGTSSAVISHICTGRNKPNVDLLEKILTNFTNVSVEWLVLGKGSIFITEGKDSEEVPEKEVSSPSSLPDAEEEKNANESEEELQLLHNLISAQQKAVQSMEKAMDAQGELIRFLNSKEKERKPGKEQ